jgi:hypothetical protein
VSVAMPAHVPKPACGPPRKLARMLLPMTSQGIISPVNRAYQYHVMSGRAALKPIKSPVWNAGSDGAKWQWKQAPRRAPKRTLPRDATEETPFFDRRDVSRRRWCASMSISRASRRAEPKFRLGRSITSPFEVRRPPLKAAVTFLGVNGWKRQWQNRIIGHGGRGLRG